MALISAADLVDAPGELRPRIGGKGLGLVRLLRLGMDVPAFFVIDASEWVADGQHDLIEPITQALAELGNGPVAVRSSAVMEDGAQHSFAGQLETVLGVEGPQAVSDAVGVCMRSGASERVLAYCRERGVEPGAVAVVVQRQIDPVASGVLFSRDPSDPDRSLISAAWGLGEGVVQGAVPCDTFRVDDGGAIEPELDVKDTALRLHDGRVVEAQVPAEDHGRPCLSDAHVRRLHALGRTLEASLRRPQDIEFAITGNRIHVLQVRPITVPIPVGRKQLWDNSNIVESYNGVTTPMTFSFARRAYTIVYQLFCRVMGVPQRVITANQATFKVMIGLIRGRIYYNLNSWYRVLTLLPAYEFNRSAMEQMMGVAEVASDQDAEADKAGWQRALIHGPRLVWLMGALSWRLLRLDRDVARFHTHFAQAHARYDGQDLTQRTPFELLDIYDELEQELLWEWTPPIVNDFFVMVFYGLLRKRCQAITGDPDTNLHNELLAGQGGLESTEPTIEALKIAAWMRTDAALTEAFTDDDRSDAALLELARGHERLGPELARYLERYGDRCIDELKLESPSLKHDPTFVIATLRNYLRAQPMDPARFGESERALRDQAEGHAFSRVSGTEARVFRWILKQTRTRVRDRENLRFARTRIFGFVRELIRAWGWHLVQSDHLDTVQDVFFLTLDEVQEFLRGTAVTTDLRGLVALRKAEYQGYEQGARPGERFHTRGPVHVANPFKGAVVPSIDGDTMVGTGCCPGVVEGPVIVLDDPKQGARLQGEILVAERTDPGWVPLYPSISGLLVERGSLLSHSAVVAREMGIPTVVGLRGLTGWIQTGDTVRLDGDAGTVEKQ